MSSRHSFSHDHNQECVYKTCVNAFLPDEKEIFPREDRRETHCFASAHHETDVRPPCGPPPVSGYLKNRYFDTSKL
jgi:hypothetical protein